MESSRAKRWLAVVFVLSLCITGTQGVADASPGDITTVAGNGEEGSTGDGGPATDATFVFMESICADADGNLYVADPDVGRIRKIDDTGTVTTLAGGGTEDAAAGGLATETLLRGPVGVALDSSRRLYIAESESHRILRVEADGTIQIVAGDGYTDENGAGRYFGDGGPATAASLSFPFGLHVDESGNLYIADSLNNRIRRVDPSGTITTVAGNGLSVLLDGGVLGDGGPATDASLSPRDICVDNVGALYILDEGAASVRKVDASGHISTVAGGLVTSAGFSGDGGPATEAEIRPLGIAVDVEGNLYIADGENDRVRRVGAETGIITTIAGDGYVDESTGTKGRFAGDGGPATLASLSYPIDVAVDNLGNIYIADAHNGRVRMVEGPAAAPVGLATDYDANGKVDFADFLVFVGAFGARVGDEKYDVIYDLESDGKVDFADFLLFVADFGKRVEDGGGFDLVETWELTSLEGFPVDLGTSTWVFESDGTYFFELPQFQLDGGGNWSLSGTTLTMDGEFEDALEMPVIELTFGEGGDSFSLVTLEDETWVYGRQ